MGDGGTRGGGREGGGRGGVLGEVHILLVSLTHTRVLECMHARVEGDPGSVVLSKCLYNRQLPCVCPVINEKVACEVKSSHSARSLP